MSLSADEMSPLEQFVLRHDLPDFQIDQVRDLEALTDALANRALGVMARTRIQKQIAHLATVHQLVAQAINNAKGA